MTFLYGNDSKPTPNMQVNDDLAAPFRLPKVVAAIPAFGRLHLLKITIERLYKKNGVFRVIVAGDEPAVEKLCAETGAVFVHHANNPLGAKWNAAFQKAKDFDPDACLFMGSSDWISEKWLDVLCPYLESADMIGKPDCYFLDIGVKEMRAVHWPGYTRSDRAGESIGIGRLLSRRILDSVDWMPFDPRKDNSLDHSMQQNVLAAGGKLRLVTSGLIKSLSISTYAWPNKHQFIQHWSGVLPSEKILNVNEFVQKNFPEALTIFK